MLLFALYRKKEVRSAMTIKVSIPKWCIYHQGKKICCRCGKHGIYYQEGDYKNLHSLCITCYFKVKEGRQPRK